MNLDHNYAIIWDMDGVLVKTGEYHYESWKKTFDELNVPFSEEQFRATFGMNNAGILEVICGEKLPPDQEQRISERKESSLAEAVKGKVTKLLPGIEKALEKFLSMEFETGNCFFRAAQEHRSVGRRIRNRQTL